MERGSISGNLGVFLGSIIFFFLLGELLVRIVPETLLKKVVHVEYNWEYGYPKGMFQGDIWLPHRYVSNFKGTFHGDGYQDIPISINAYGQRDRTFPLKKPVGTFRILGLGDSITFGAGVRNEDTFLKQLETMLAGHERDVIYQTINAGVNSYENLEELIYLKEEGLRFQPDLVIVGFCINDVAHRRLRHPYATQFSRALEEGLPEPLGTKFNQVKQNEGKMVKQIETEIRILKEYREPWAIPVPFKKLWFRYSRFFKIVSQLYDKILVRYRLRDYGARYFNHLKRLWLSRAWDITKLQILEFQRLAGENNFRLLFLIFPKRIQIGSTERFAIAQLSLVNFMKSFKIPFIDLLHAFQKSPSSQDLFLPRDRMHFSVEGHRLSAEAIYRYLQKTKIIPAT